MSCGLASGPGVLGDELLPVGGALRLQCNLLKTLQWHPPHANTISSLLPDHLVRPTLAPPMAPHTTGRAFLGTQPCASPPSP